METCMFLCFHVLIYRKTCMFRVINFLHSVLMFSTQNDVTVNGLSHVCMYNAHVALRE